MERIGVDDSKSATIEALEHLHRYHWAKGLAVGRVLDIACGVGYGADILMKSRAVTEYVGTDNSPEAIGEAIEHFLGPKRRFDVAEAESLPYPDDTFNTVVTFETLEHVPDPKEAVCEFRRVLKPDGVLIGSVPTQNFEKLCERLYGENPYHLTKLTERGLRRLLTKHFGNPLILTCCLEVASCVNFDYPRASDDRTARVVQLFGENRADLGSFLFLAGNIDAKKLSKRWNEFALGLNYFVQEKPLREAIRRSEELLEERDALIKSQSRMIEEGDQVIRDQGALVEERDNLIRNQAAMVEERDARIREQAEEIRQRDSVIRE